MIAKHFSSQFENELHVVSARLTELERQVDTQISRIIEALTHADAAGANHVLAAEAEVNALEIDIDHEITSIIAKRQPVARDLRLLMAISKVAGNLERVDMETDRMAHQVLKLVRGAASYVLPSQELCAAADFATGQLRKALDAFSRLDLVAAEALAVMKRDDTGYQDVQALVRKLIDLMIESPKMISYCVELIYMTKSLELVLDNARHIAEQVIYVVQGTDVRHTPIEQVEPLAS
jgi:phosphate transport system protein